MDDAMDPRREGMMDAEDLALLLEGRGDQTLLARLADSPDALKELGALARIERQMTSPEAIGIDQTLDSHIKLLQQRFFPETDPHGLRPTSPPPLRMRLFAGALALLEKTQGWQALQAPQTPPFAFRSPDSAQDGYGQAVILLERVLDGFKLNLRIEVVDGEWAHMTLDLTPAAEADSLELRLLQEGRLLASGRFDAGRFILRDLEVGLYTVMVMSQDGRELLREDMQFVAADI